MNVLKRMTRKIRDGTDHGLFHKLRSKFRRNHVGSEFNTSNGLYSPDFRLFSPSDPNERMAPNYTAQTSQMETENSGQNRADEMREQLPPSIVAQLSALSGLLDQVIMTTVSDLISRSRPAQLEPDINLDEEDLMDQNSLAYGIQMSTNTGLNLPVSENMSFGQFIHNLRNDEYLLSQLGELIVQQREAIVQGTFNAEADRDSVNFLTAFSFNNATRYTLGAGGLQRLTPILIVGLVSVPFFENGTFEETNRSWVVIVMSNIYPANDAVIRSMPTFLDLLRSYAAATSTGESSSNRNVVNMSVGLSGESGDSDWNSEHSRRQIARFFEAMIPSKGIKKEDLDKDTQGVFRISIPVTDDDNSFYSTKSHFEETTTPFPTKTVQHDDSCPICLINYKNGDYGRALVDCKHQFHRECIDQWLIQGENVCPLCRGNGIVISKT